MRKIYLAIPYSGMQESSYEQATIATAILLKKGFNVYSPITHSHPLTKQGIDLPHSWDFWEKIDKQFIDWADEVYVMIPIEGYEKILSSIGVQAEIAYAKEKNMNINYITMNSNHTNLIDVNDMIKQEMV